MTDTRRSISLTVFGLLLCATGHAQANPQSPPPLNVVLGQTHLQLIDHAGRCALSESGKRPRELEMAWPCQFAPDRQGSARIETARKTPVALVMRSEPQSPPETGCLTQTQAVRLINGQLETSVRMDTAGCGYGADQKVFVGLFDW